MIKVVCWDKKIEISGHAYFESYGKDIVCASVSSIIFTTLNGILNINDKAIQYINDDILEIFILSDDEITAKLIKNMIDLLKELEKQYPKNIIVKENKDVIY